MDYQEVLKFWFEEPQTVSDKMTLWFGGTPEIDERIKKRFEPWVISAFENKGGWIESWAQSPQSCVALIILLDQFPLNIYRDQARSFEMIERALPLAKRAIAQGVELKLGLFERFFMLLPLEHSESLLDQKQSMSLFEKLRHDARATGDPSFIGPIETFYDYAQLHYDVIERFGRYPDRNPILGRPPTLAEIEYMAAGGPPF